MTKKIDLESEIMLANRGTDQTLRMWYFFAADGDWRVNRVVPAPGVPSSRR